MSHFDRSIFLFFQIEASLLHWSKIWKKNFFFFEKMTPCILVLWVFDCATWLSWFSIFKLSQCQILMDDTEGGSKMALCYYGAFFEKARVKRVTKRRRPLPEKYSSQKKNDQKERANVLIICLYKTIFPCFYSDSPQNPSFLRISQKIYKARFFELDIQIEYW